MTLTPYTPIAERGYARPEVLVSTEWVAAHLDDPSIRLVSCSEDPLLYDKGHIPGAIRIEWMDLISPVVWDFLEHGPMQVLLRSRGLNRDSTLVFYGDQNNWWACYAFWVLRLFGLDNLRIMDGGHQLWEKEGRPMVVDWPDWPPGDIELSERHDAPIRALRQDVLAHVERGGVLLDVRSGEEFAGRRLHMSGYPNEGARRGGHIPGARNVLWALAVNPETHTFKTAAELGRIYLRGQGLRPGDDTVVYCRIGERAAHTWFVLTYLLGFSQVRNYDGSWLEWGNSVAVPIERN